MKKILKGFAIFFCITGLMVYTGIMIVDHSQVFPATLLDALMILFLYLLLRKKKVKVEDKQSDNNLDFEHSKQVNVEKIAEPSITVKMELPKVPPEVIQSMQKSYTKMQAQNDLRILKDCLDLIEKTTNLDTFFSRYELGMRTAFTLRQAEQAGIIKNTYELPTVFFNAAESQKNRILTTSFQKESESIAKLKTEKAKANHWKKYLDLLEEHESDLIDLDTYQQIKQYVSEHM